MIRRVENSIDRIGGEFVGNSPNGRILAATYLRLKDSGVKFDGFADHLVSESLYLRDPENNGIEICRDRPAEEWPRDTSGSLWRWYK